MARSEAAATRAERAGRIDAPKVRAILDATGNLPAERASALQDKVLVHAPEQTAGQVRAAVARAVISVDPAGAAQRHREARRDRRVAVNPNQDGMASLWALLPAPDAVSGFEWLTRLARGMGAEDPRGMDARRADLLSALLAGRLTVAAAEGGGQVAMPEPVNPGKPLVQVVIPFDTLNGTAEHPRDVECRHPICRRRAIDSELDHTIAFAGDGACPHHHHLKHEAPGRGRRA